MRIELDREPTRAGRGSLPVYRQIAAAIRAEIEAGRLASGDRLPAIRDLAKELGVNRDTVATAYETLAGEGVVESGVGRGTFVADQSNDAATDRSFEQTLSPATERLLRFERSRPRFGSGRGAVPMHALVPDPAHYPTEEFRKVLNRVMQRGGSELLLYGDPQGHPRMREVLAGRLSKAGIDVGAEEILLCHGASQGISLSLRLYAESGDTIACEEPTYNNVLATAYAHGLRTVPVPMRENGLDLAVLDRTLAR